MEIAKNNSLKEKIKDITLTDGQSLDSILDTEDILNQIVVDDTKFTLQTSYSRCVRNGKVIDISLGGKLVSAVSTGTAIATLPYGPGKQIWGVFRTTGSTSWFGSWLDVNNKVNIEPISGDSIPADTSIQVHYVFIID